MKTMKYSRFLDKK